MSVWCITLYCHSRHVSHWGFPWAKNITTTGCSSDIPPMLCHSRHASQRGTRFFFYNLKIAPYHINVSTSFSTFILLNALTTDGLYMAYHFPSQQYIGLQKCKHCFAIILRGGCSHNWPDSDSVNENVSFLQYILYTIGVIIIDWESSSPV